MRRAALAAMACALVLQGCAGALVQDDWQARPIHPALPSHLIEVVEADLPRICGDHPGMMLHGCAIRVFDARVCLIYTGPQPAAWLIEHERKHCAGWDHGPQRARVETHVAATSPLAPAEGPWGQENRP